MIPKVRTFIFQKLKHYSLTCNLDPRSLLSWLQRNAFLAYWQKKRSRKINFAGVNMYNEALAVQKDIIGMY